MNILLIEDDENKTRQLMAYVSMKFPDARLEVRRSYTSGLRYIREILQHIILLDMSIPNYDGDMGSSDGGKFRSYGGRDILWQMSRRRIRARVVVVTAYDSFSTETDAKSLDTLTEELRREFADNFMGTVFFSVSQDYWKTDLDRILAG